MHYGMIMIHLVSVCFCTMLLQYYRPYSLCCMSYLQRLLFYNWRFEPLNPLHLFYPPPTPLLSGNYLFDLCIYGWFPKFLTVVMYFTLSSIYIELKQKFYETIFISLHEKPLIFSTLLCFQNAGCSPLNWLVLICRFKSTVFLDLA